MSTESIEEKKRAGDSSKIPLVKAFFTSYFLFFNPATSLPISGISGSSQAPLKKDKSSSSSPSDTHPYDTLTSFSEDGTVSVALDHYPRESDYASEEEGTSSSAEHVRAE